MFTNAYSVAKLMGMFGTVPETDGLLEAYRSSLKPNQFTAPTPKNKSREPGATRKYCIYSQKVTKHNVSIPGPIGLKRLRKLTGGNRTKHLLSNAAF